MADQKDPKRQDQAGSKRPSQGAKQNENDNEWLRDQVGEDHNLSGSSTFRTLPDQPEGEEDNPDVKNRGSKDAKDRQSNR